MNDLSGIFQQGGWGLEGRITQNGRGKWDGNTLISDYHGIPYYGDQKFTPDGHGGGHLADGRRVLPDANGGGWVDNTRIFPPK